MWCWTFQVVRCSHLEVLPQDIPENRRLHSLATWTCLIVLTSWLPTDCSQARWVYNWAGQPHRLGWLIQEHALMLTDVSYRMTHCIIGKVANPRRPFALHWWFLCFKLAIRLDTLSSTRVFILLSPRASFCPSTEWSLIQGTGGGGGWYEAHQAVIINTPKLWSSPRLSDVLLNSRRPLLKPAYQSFLFPHTIINGPRRQRSSYL